MILYTSLLFYRRHIKVDWCASLNFPAMEFLQEAYYPPCLGGQPAPVRVHNDPAGSGHFFIVLYVTSFLFEKRIRRDIVVLFTRNVCGDPYYIFNSSRRAGYAIDFYIYQF
jgi:hypothetical protein